MDKKDFETYMKVFLDKNSKINLISKNDEKFLWEKHIFDSLAIENFFEKYNFKDLKNKTLLDIGTGGGFPSIPAAIRYPDLDVTAVDSIRKKINAVCEIKAALQLENLHPVCSRAEDLKNVKYDFVVSRAVASLKILIPYAFLLLKQDGYFIAYKSIKAEDEIKEAQNIIRKYNVRVVDIIEYDLPLKINSDGKSPQPRQTTHLSIPKSLKIPGILRLCPKVSAKYPIKSSHPNSAEIFKPISRFFSKQFLSVKNSSTRV